MSVPEPTYDFRKEAARTFMSGQTQTVLLTGHTTDLFYLTSPFAGEQRPNGNYVGLLDYLRATWSRDSQTILLAYEVNGSIEIVNRDRDEPLLRDAWVKCRTLEILSDINAQAKASGGKQKPIDLDEACRRAEQQWVDFQLFVSGDATKALKFLRKLCRVSRESCEGDALFGKRIVILLEDVHLLIPDGEVSRLGPDDRARAILCRDWFTSTDFQRSFDAVVLIAESASQINGEVRTLPQLLQVDVPSPDLDARRHFIKWFNTTQPDRAKIKLWGSQTDLARQSAGLSLHALWQLLRGSVYDGVELNPASVTKRVEAYILSQLGEGTVEFHKPVHTLDAIVGNTKLVHYLRTRVMPRMRSTGRRSLRGVAVSGPIGAGKTFIFEGVAAELGMPVLVLKNLRSKWFGETDVILERLYRVLSSLSKVALFVDEADTMFGGVGADQHATERRLTGKIQGWMSDPRLKGRVIWILMTARPQNLSPDIRRPGRVGNLIIPVLDPTGDDRTAFIQWVLEDCLETLPEIGSEEWRRINEATLGYSAAQFDALRDELAAELEFLGEGEHGPIRLNTDQVIDIIEEQISADIETARRVQELYALINCTRKSLLPDGEKLVKAQVLKLKEEWAREIHLLQLAT